jgi:alpha-tubulin suppressor-like RCC1 family protein
VLPGPPHSIEFLAQPPALVLAGVALNPAISLLVKDAYANPVSSVQVTVSLTDGARVPIAALGGTLARTTVAGAVAFDDLTVDTVGAGYVIVAATSTSTSATSTAFHSVRPGYDFRLTTISAGLDQSCGLDAMGRAWCWGANWAGQLGDGSVTDRPAPVPVAGGLTFMALSGGGGGYEDDMSFTCGVSTDGDAYCWGTTLRGALGDGRAFSSHLTPAMVAGGLKFRTLSAGGEHVCALTTDDRAYCWGSNEAGELGVGDRSIRTTPTTVAGGAQFATISAGELRTCATNSAGIWCWGGNGINGSSSVPTRVATALEFESISTGTQHTCGLTAAGKAYCWGDNSSGQLGNGGGGSSFTPVLVSGSDPFEVLSTRGYSACALHQGVGYCWGWNHLGQLGAGFVTPREQSVATPHRVAGSSTFSALSVNVWHACALTPAGDPWCWGLNTWGQLGNGTGVNSTVPVPVVVP